MCRALRWPDVQPASLRQVRGDPTLMDTDTGRITAKPESIPDLRRFMLKDDEHKKLKPLTRKQRLVWYAQLRKDGRLPEQQGKPQWPKKGRSRAKRSAQRIRR
jgi:hypothetical protein